MRILIFLFLFMGVAAGAWGNSIGDRVEVTIRSDDGRELPLYPAASRPSGCKAYAEAVKGDNYSIVVRNRLNRRVGVVVAVDGRNIISGGKSLLGRNERMYILEPHEVGEYEGWRTGDDRVNRFYFTTAADSYAAAFNDESAMGVIAVAVYPEVRYEAYREIRDKAAGATAPRALPAPSAQMAALGAKREESAGTGYGKEEYSPVRIVEFEPETKALERVYIKYEWHATLCRKGVIACMNPPSLRNRFWKDEGYAPPPPGRN